MPSQLTALRRIGTREVSALGLGCAGLSLDHAGEPARAERAILSAVDAGITLFDTALVYTPSGEENHNERLIHRVLARLPRSTRDELLIATKGGHYRDGDAFPVDARPQTLRTHCEASLRSLGTDRIGLYYLHWPDPEVPIEESVGALADLRQEGKVEQIGVSNVDLDQLRRAQRTTTLACVQNKLSLFDQSSRNVLSHCEKTSTAFVAYSPLGGVGNAQRSVLPTALNETADRHGLTAAQAALGWLLALSPVAIPIVGATRPENVASAVEAVRTELTPVEIRSIGTG